MSITNARTLATLCFFALALAGCGGGVADQADGIGKTVVSGGGTSQPDVDPSVFARQGFCPPIEVRADTFSLSVYARGRDGDPQGLQYQGSIRKYARECRRIGDMLLIKVGVAGRVVAGPVATDAPVVLPVRVAVTGSDDTLLASELIPVEVGLQESGGTVAWSRVVDEIQVPADGARKVYVGFDADDGKRRR